MKSRQGLPKVVPGNLHNKWQGLETTHRDKHQGFRNQPLHHFVTLKDTGRMRATGRAVEADGICNAHGLHPDLLTPAVLVLRGSSNTMPDRDRVGHIPIELSDGSQSADVATTARQNREVVSVQGQKETLRRKFWLRKRRLISI